MYTPVGWGVMGPPDAPDLLERVAIWFKELREKKNAS